MARKEKAPAPKVRGVYERPPGSGTWYIQYFDGVGKRHRESIGSYDLAVETYHKRRREIKDGRYDPEALRAKRKKRYTVSQAVDDYLKESKATKRSWKDDERYGDVWKGFLGTELLEHVRPADVERWRRQRGRDEVKPATINRHVAFSKRVFNVAIRDGHCETNPVARIKRLKENNSRFRFLTQAQKAQLRAKFPADRWHIVELAHTRVCERESSVHCGGMMSTSPRAS